MWRYSACLAALALAGCRQYPTGGNIRLHDDMGTQPSYRAQRDPRPLAEGAVPRPARNAAASGAILFAIYCTPCHGERGKGDGPIAARITRPADLSAAKYVASDDAFFLKTMTQGSGLMPPQAESLWPEERGEVVKHIRKLQKP